MRAPYGRLLAAMLLSAAARPAAAGGVLLSDPFDYPDGVITNAYAARHPDAPDARRVPLWEAESGSLFSSGGAAWSGVPDAASPDAASARATGSAVLRLRSRRADLKDVAVSFRLLLQGLPVPAGASASPGDGVRVVLRDTGKGLYALAVDRRDGSATIVKTAQGTSAALATGYLDVSLGAWQKVRASVRDKPDGTVALRLFADGRALAAAVDDGRQAGPPLGAGRVGVDADNADFKLASFLVADLGGLPAAGGPPALDRFGVRQLYPPAPGGQQWSSSWDNGAPRAFAGKDPGDPWFDADHGSASYKVDGRGVLASAGPEPRMLVREPGLARQWRNVEMTVYAKASAAPSGLAGRSPAGPAFTGAMGTDGLAAMARTNHGASGPEAQNPCDARAAGARWRADGHAELAKETTRLHRSAAGDAAAWPGGFPAEAWVGLKLVVYDLPNGDVRLESWVDGSDGADGGDWVKVAELTDDGTSLGAGGVPCAAGVDPALRLAAGGPRTGSESGKPDLAVLWEGADGFLYKKMSVREIVPAAVAPSTGLPVVSLTAPRNGARVSGGVLVSAAASDERGVAGVQFRLDGKELGPEVTVAPFSLAWNTGLVADGPHALQAVARGLSGAMAVSSPVSVAVSNSFGGAAGPVVTAGGDGGDAASAPPTVSLAAPLPGTTVYGSVPVSATASDAQGVAGILFMLDGADGVPLGPEVSKAPWAVLWNAASVPPGPHTLQAVARDAAGLTAVSAPLAVLVSTALPPSPPPETATTQRPVPPAPQAAAPAAARAPQKFLTPARADGVNDEAVFGPTVNEVSVYDLAGRRVTRLERAGAALRWKGRDDTGRVVESGVYIARLRTDDGGTQYQAFAVAK